jgi:hypothetical protein
LTKYAKQGSAKDARLIGQKDQAGHKQITSMSAEDKNAKFEQSDVGSEAQFAPSGPWTWYWSVMRKAVGKADKGKSRPKIFLKSSLSGKQAKQQGRLTTFCT